jgi:hypothetical protein
MTPDYDSDLDRWSSWESPQDVHEMVAPELCGPVLDAGCGDGKPTYVSPSKVVAC